MAYTICIIKGDGIGLDVVSQAMRVLEHIPLSYTYIETRAGYQCYIDTGSPLPKETITACQKADAILFGAVTTPPNIKNYFSPIIALRSKLGLFANVRPFFSLPLPGQRQDVDCILIRENTEDLYSGRERLTKDGAIAERVITKKASEKIIDFAFQLAVKKKRKKVTVIHKANVLRLTDGLFLDIARRTSQKYPDILFEDMLVDACAANLIKKPDYFDVLVTTNMFGDILSDEAAALVGGLGVAASANIGDKQALFEPVHGSAPKYKGKNTVNPLACFFSLVMMLEYLNEQKTAERLRQSILKIISAGCLTQDLGGHATTTEVTDEVIKAYNRK